MTIKNEADNEIVSFKISEYENTNPDSSPAMPKVKFDLKFEAIDIELKKFFSGSESFMLRVVLNNNSKELNPTYTTSSQRGTVNWIDIKNGTPKIVYNIDDSLNGSILFEVIKGSENSSPIKNSIEGNDTLVLTSCSSSIATLKKKLIEVQSVKNAEGKSAA